MRRTYIACGIATVAIGLLVFRGGIGLAAVPRDILGDALWATMMVWWVSAIVPARSLMVRAAISLGLCYFVEISQLIRAPWLDRLRASALGHLVLGSGFDPRDLVAYAGGVLVAVAIDRMLRSRVQRR